MLEPLASTAPDPAFAEVAGARIAYRLRPGAGPTLLFLPGYLSDMEGMKAQALDRLAEQRGQALLRFDYSGTGASPGDFATATLARWIEEVVALIERLTTGPLILVGSSMGGWVALHVALALPGRVEGLVGIAPAPDFTQWGIPEREKQALVRDGKIDRQGVHASAPMPIHRPFFDSGQQLRLLEAPIALDLPVRLVHGDADADVPLEISLKLMERLRSADVQLTIVKDGGHRLSEPHQLALIARTVTGLLER